MSWLLRRLAGLPAPGLLGWLQRVHDALAITNDHYPFLAYGTDWLVFAHLILAVVFVALIAGYVRGISFYWRLLDCSFGVIGAVPLILCLRYVAQLEKMDA